MRIGTLLARLSILAAIGGLLPLAAGLWWGFELVSHFRVQYLIGALPLMLATLGLRRRLPALALAAVAALNAWPLLPYVPLGEGPQDGVRLDVLNVNINSRNRDRAAIVGSIRAAAPDIVVVVELTPEIDEALLALADDYPYRFTFPAAHSFGIGILSRYPLVQPESLSLSGRPAIDTRIELPAGTLRFIAAHLVPPMGREPAARRNRQLDELAVLAGRGDDALLVCGDFNLTPYSPFFTRFTEETGLRDTRRRQGLDFSWPSDMPLLRIPIDHCLARGPIETESVERLEHIGSDHYPVRVRLRWQDSE